MKNTSKVCKRLLALVLAAIMALSVGVTAFAQTLGPVIVQLSGGDAQRHTVANYQSANAGYKSSLMGGYAVPLDGSNGNPDICVPGLSNGDNMVPQGLSYWAEKNWILISAYEPNDAAPSVVYALRASDGHLVAQFNLQNASGSWIYEHVSGIACSGHNLYIADAGSKMAYIPLSELDVAEGTVKTVRYAGSVDFSGELNNANTSYASWGDGILWTGNFFIDGDSSYGTRANSASGTMMLGYDLNGCATSAAEWAALTALVGNPSYCIPLDAYGINKVQCATVKNGFCYVGTSYGRTNDSTMYIFNVNLASGQGTLSVNGRTKPRIVLTHQRSYTHLPMTEGLMVYDGYLWNIFESAAWLYNGKESSVSKNPTDVLWRFDITTLLGIDREEDEESATGQALVKMPNVSCGDVKFIVPEVIYLQPKANSNTQATTANFQYYVNNDSDGSVVTSYSSTGGNIYYAYAGASGTPTLTYKFYNENLSGAMSGGSVTLSSPSTSNGTTTVTITGGTSPSIDGGDSGCYIEWKLSYTDSNDGKAKAAYAYTYVYKPYIGVIAAAGRIQHTWTDFWMQSVAYMYGVHAVPSLGSYSTRGYLSRVFYDNLTGGLKKDDGTNADNTGVNGLWVQSGTGTANYTDYGDTSSDGKSSVTTAPRGVLNVDTSRYTNFNQIPNFKIGWQCSDDESSNYYCIRLYLGDGTGTRIDPKKDKGSKGNPDGDSSLWLKPTQMSGAITSSTSYAYFHTDCGTGKSHYIWNVEHVYCDIQKADKSTLRTAVQNATKAMAKLGVSDAANGKPISLYFETNGDYRWTAFRNAYKNAVIGLTRLDSTPDVTQLVDALNNALAALCTHYVVDGNGGTLSAAQEGYVTIGTNQSASVTVSVTASRTGYTFVGWNVDANATTGSQSSVTVGYNNTIYAIWRPNTYQVAFDGNGATGGSVSPNPQTFTYDQAQDLAANGFTKSSYTVTYKYKNGASDTTDTAVDSFAGWLGSASLINDATEYGYNNTSGSSYKDIKQWTISAPFAANEVYHLEFDAKGSGVVTNYFYGASGYWTVGSSTGTNPSHVGGGDGDIRHTLSSSYQHFAITWTLSASGNANVNKYVLFRALSGSSVTFKNVRFWKETGSVSYTDQQNVTNLCTADGAIYQMRAQWTPGSVTLPTPTYAGHTFGGWYSDDACTTLVGAAGASYTPTANTTLYAKWTLINYTITYDLASGALPAGVTNPTSYTVNDTVNIADPTKTGYTFTGWSGTGLTGSANTSVTIPAGSTGNRSYTAHWSINSYTITFDTDGGSAIAAITQNYGTAITAPANPTKEGHTFGGWTKNGAAASVPATMPAEDITLVATWTVNSYTITFDTDGGSSISPITQNYGTAITAPANPTKTGYTFAGWTKNGAAASVPATMPAESYTLKATWTINQYTITFDTDGGSAIAAITQNYGTAITAPANPTKTGYTFAGWTKAGVAASVPATMPAESYTLKATWTINQYTITFDTDGGSAIAAITQNYGTAITAPANPTKTGYTFNGWTKNGAAASVPATMPAESYTLVATWSLNSHTITYVTGGGSAVAADTVNYGAALPSRSTSQANAVFDGWVYTGNGATYTGTTMPDYDLTATAQWIFPVTDDTFVLSSNRATNLNVLSNDKSGTALVSVGTVTGFSTAIANDKIRLTPSGQINSAVTFTYTASYNGSGSFTATVTIVPASNVYYEESGFITFESSAGAPTWQDAGAEYANVFEEGQRPGASGSPMTAYQTTNETTYSLGNAKFVEVSAAAKGGATATFTFSGTGFDFYSVTNNQSGLAFVDVYKVENGQETNVESTLINTYFGYKYGRLYLKDNAVSLDSSGTPIYNTSETGSGTFFIEGERRGTTTPTDEGFAYGWVAGSNEITGVYQVPVISWSSDTGYGTYKVVIEPRWSARQNMTGGNSYKFYVDAVRVYNPIDPSTITSGTAAYDAYMEDGEYGACYQSVRDLLIDADSFGNTNGTGTAGVAFLEPGKDVTVKDYKDVGPKNEVYLNPGQAIAFNLTTAAQTTPAKLSIGLRLAQGTTGGVTVYSKDTTGVSLTVSGATELYRDITEAVTWQSTNGGACTTSAPIIIANTSANDSGAVISITNLKWSYDTAVTPVNRMLSFSFAPQDLVTASAVMRQTQTVTPDTPAAPQTPQPDAFSGRRMITLQALIEQIFGRFFEALRLAFIKK